MTKWLELFRRLLGPYLPSVVTVEDMKKLKAMFDELHDQAKILWPGFGWDQFKAVAFRPDIEGKVRSTPGGLSAVEWIACQRQLLVEALNEQYGTPGKRLR